MIRTEVPVGGREGRHTHPGTFLGLVEQGTFQVDYEGKPSATYKAGDSFFVDAGKIHEGINVGDVPVKVLLTLVVENGATLVTPVK
jgi:quercetin dioxygenase-like cupin family protein